MEVAALGYETAVEVVRKLDHQAPDIWRAEATRRKMVVDGAFKLDDRVPVIGQTAASEMETSGA